MPINADYEFINAEKEYYRAQTIAEKIAALENMISKAPSHKGAESLRADLKSRLKKLVEKQEKSKSTGKTTRKVIKKEGFQCALIGLTNTGKSSLLSVLTNAKSRIENYAFTTKEPEVGSWDYGGVRAQIVDLPSIGSDCFDIGLANTADCLLIVVEKIEEIEEIEKVIPKASSKRIIVFNKADLLNESEIRKLAEKIKSKRINAVIFSCVTKSGLTELNEKIFFMMDSIRVYTKEPGKQPSTIPMVLSIGSTVRDAAESILKGFSARVKETRITGPSSKFPNQKVGLAHILKDRDIVEFHTN